MAQLISLAPPKPEDAKTTYRRLRKAIGWLGILLAPTLIGLSQLPFFQTEPQPSISHYYYTNLRELFTGVLCAVALFMIRYKGHYNPVWWKNDDFMTSLAGCMALGVALVPTNPVEERWCQKIYTLLPIYESWTGALHYGFAAALFLIMAVLCLFVFTIGHRNEVYQRDPLISENYQYRLYGTIILLCILAIAVNAIVWDGRFENLTFWGEMVALLAFGMAWLIKGRAFGDSGSWGRLVYNEAAEKTQKA